MTQPSDEVHTTMMMLGRARAARRAWSVLLGLGAVVLLALGLIGSRPAIAQEQGAESRAVQAAESDSADESSDGAAADATAVEDGDGRGATTFQPSSGEQEKTPGYTLMIIAYLAMWILLAGYVYQLYRRQKKVGRELDELRSRIDALDEELEGGA